MIEFRRSVTGSPILLYFRKGKLHMSIKDYLIKTCGITEEQFDEVAEAACRIKETGVPICKELRDSELFELFASYGRANRERRKEA